MNRIQQDARRVVRTATQYPATVVDVHGTRATVKLSGNGAKLSNLSVVGGPVDIGEQVQVDYTTPEPTIVATSKDWLSIEDILRALNKLPKPVLEDPTTEFDKLVCFCIDDPTQYFFLRADPYGFYDAVDIILADREDLTYARRWGLRFPPNFASPYNGSIDTSLFDIEFWTPMYVWGAGKDNVHVRCTDLYVAYGVYVENIYFDFWRETVPAYVNTGVRSIGFAWNDPPVPIEGNPIMSPANNYLLLPDQVFNGQIFRNCKFRAGCGDYLPGGDTDEGYNYSTVHFYPGDLDAFYWTRSADDIMIFENCQFITDQESCYEPHAFQHSDWVYYPDGDGYKTHVYLYDCEVDVGANRMGNSPNAYEVHSVGTRWVDVPNILGMDNHDILGTSDRAALDHVHGSSGSSGGYDENALHDNVTGEINMVTEKTDPVSTDLLLIEDSEASYAKKKLQIGNLPFSSGSGSSGSGGGATNFLDLDDTPSSYTSQSGKLVSVKSTEDALEFVDAPTGGSGGTPILETAGSTSTDSHTSTGSWEAITSGSVAITPSAAGRDLLCLFTFTIEPKSANWEHYKIRFLLDGSTASYEWLWERDANPSNNPRFVWTIHWVFENVDASEHTIQMQWHDNTSNQDVDITTRKLTVIEAL